MIRFGVVASVVSAAVALLIVGAVSGDLKLVYVSIGLAALALVMLVVGVAVWRDRVFAGTSQAGGVQAAADQHGRAQPVGAPAGPAQAGHVGAGQVEAGHVEAGRAAAAHQAGLAPAGRPAPAKDRRARPAAVAGGPARPDREVGAPAASSHLEDEHPADRGRPEQEFFGRQPGSVAQRSGAASWSGRQRETASADRAGPEPSGGSGRPGRATGPADGPEREVSPSGRAPRRPDSVEPPPAERAGAAGGSARWPEGAGPYSPAEQPQPADDPIRLAHRLGIGRQEGPDTGLPAASQRPADPTAASRMRRDLPADPATEKRSQADPLAGPLPAGPSSVSWAPPGTEPATGPATSERPETSAEPVAPEPTRASTLAGSSLPPRPATAAAGPASVTPADEPPRSPTGVPPRSTSATTVAAEGAAESAPAAAGDAEAVSTGTATTGAAATDEGGGQSGESGTTASADTEVLVVPGIARFHQPDCILIRFLGEDDLQKMPRREAEAAGCVACRACRP